MFTGIRLLHTDAALSLVRGPPDATFAHVIHCCVVALSQTPSQESSHSLASADISEVIKHLELDMTEM